jgi:hypothetical protein
VELELQEIVRLAEPLTKARKGAPGA